MQTPANSLLSEDVLKRISDATFFSRLKNSRTGEELGKILAVYTDAALADFVRYSGNDPQELWNLRARWKARNEFQNELLGVMEAKIEDLEAVATELGIDVETLQLRSLIEDVGDDDPQEP